MTTKEESVTAKPAVRVRAALTTVIAAVVVAVSLLVSQAPAAHAATPNYTADPYWIDLVNVGFYRMGSAHWTGRIDTVHTGGRLRGRVAGTVSWPAGTPSRCARVDVGFEYHDGSGSIQRSGVSCNPANPEVTEKIYSLPTRDIVKVKLFLVTGSTSAMTDAAADSHYYMNVNAPLNSLGSCTQLQHEWDGVPVGPNYEYAFDGSGTYGCDTENGNTTAHVDGKLMWKDAISAYKLVRVRAAWLYADGTQQSSASAPLDHNSTAVPVSLTTDHRRDIRAFTVYIDGSSDGATWSQVAAENFSSHLGSHSTYSEPF